jgi:hypothetical protein
LIRLLGVPEERRAPSVDGGTSEEKIDIFLPSRLGYGIVVFRIEVGYFWRFR